MRAAVFFVTGFEEVEAIAPVDILRRGGAEVTMVSLTDDLHVTGAHEIIIRADVLFDPSANFDMLILPGGPGTKNYRAREDFMSYVRKHYDCGKKIGAICAAPLILGELGILDGKRAVCFPGVEPELRSFAVEITDAPVVTDGSVTTSRSAATALPFSLALLEFLEGAPAAQKIKNSICM